MLSTLLNKTKRVWQLSVEMHQFIGSMFDLKIDFMFGRSNTKKCLNIKNSQNFPCINSKTSSLYVY